MVKGKHNLFPVSLMAILYYMFCLGWLPSNSRLMRPQFFFQAFRLGKAAPDWGLNFPLPLHHLLQEERERGEGREREEERREEGGRDLVFLSDFCGAPRLLGFYNIFIKGTEAGATSGSHLWALSPVSV